MIVLINFPKDSDNFTKNNNFLKIFDEFANYPQFVQKYAVLVLWNLDLAIPSSSRRNEVSKGGWREAEPFRTTQQRLIANNQSSE